MAAMTLVYEDDILRIYWHDQHEYYLSDWQPVFRKGSKLKRAYQACVDAAKARPGAVWLADASKFAVLDPEDAKWVSDWFWPEFVRAGVRYQAAVQPQKEIGRMSASRATEKLAASGAMEISIHATREEAEAAILGWRRKRANG